MAELLYGRNAVLEALRAGRRKLIKLHIADGVKEGGPVGELMELARLYRRPLSYFVRRDDLKR